MGIISAKRLLGARWVQTVLGVAGAEYLRLVWKTSRPIIEPPDIYDRVDGELPIIIALWHGQHFLAPFIRQRPHHRAKVLISRHRDGELNAVAARWLGVPAIRGSGTHGTDFAKKGGVSAFAEMVQALEQGYSVALTADVPKVSRVCGLGIVKLASVSGRAIYPAALTTRRRIVMNNWDRTTINLPFSCLGVVAGAPIRVPRDADAQTLEAARQAVERELNAVTQRAYEIVDGGAGHRA